MATVSIKGMSSLISKLNRISKLDMRKRVNTATALVHGQAVNNANFEKGYQTGDLKGSIHMETKQTSTGYQGRVYTNNDHAAFVEFGTGQRGNGSYPYDIKGLDLEYKEDWAGMEAQPYLYPALESQRKEVESILSYGVHEELSKMCKGG